MTPTIACFAGIDISKATLDLALSTADTVWQFDNNKSGVPQTFSVPGQA